MQPTRLFGRSRLPVAWLHELPSSSHRVNGTRVFSGRTPLRIINTRQSRPQLPFLNTPLKGRARTTRFLTTEQKKNFKYQLRVGIYWTATGWTLVAAFYIAWTILYQDWLDHEYPSPEEWNWWCKYFWRRAHHQIATEGEGRGLINWGTVSTSFRVCVMNLENYRLWPKTPSGLIEQDDWDRSIPGIYEEDMRQPTESRVLPNRIGYDISMKSEAWRRGYFEGMLGMAQAAEHQTGWLRDNKTGMIYPPEYVRSESNPYPKAIPPSAPLRNPDIEDCVVSFESAEFHYRRLLTTKGFNDDQYIEAAIAYALWEDACGRPQTAEQLYRWSLDLARRGVPDPDSIIDSKTFVIKATAPFITRNILDTTSALANHYARHDNIPASLNIYLSVLRARRAAPEAPPHRRYKTLKPDHSLTSVDSVLSYITLMWADAKFPGPPPSRNLPFERTPHTECEEAGIMTYVGEILFARNEASRIEGLSWTRDATAMAEDSMASKFLTDQDKKFCSTCFETGLGNWSRMLAVLARESEARKAAQPSGTAVSGLRRLWASSAYEDALRKGNWSEEERLVNERIRQTEEDKVHKRISSLISHQSNFFVI